MTPGAWRELIDAYVAGRLSADAFKRRFTEAFEAAVASRAPTPASVQDLAYTVDAYAGDPMARGHDVADDEDLLRAARRALSLLPEDATAEAIAPPMDALSAEDLRAARDRMRGAAIGFGAVGAAGCAVAALWIAIGVLQFFAVAAQIQSVSDWGPAPSTLIAIPLAFIPVVGSIVAFFGAKDVWGWEPWAAALAFLALPLVSLLGGGGVVRARMGGGR
ncbi:MAG: hypothetical protein NW200_02305 [Hyphomonadaceae bacterium]|nr:hypothetical protein [Hyphomonadaceae bacterium]